MEYCDGGDLSNFIKKKRKLPENVCRKFLQQLALALKYLRENSVCHMDLKPQNLLLIKRPKLTLKVGGQLNSTGTHATLNSRYKPGFEHGLLWP